MGTHSPTSSGLLRRSIPDFKDEAARAQARLGREGARRLLDRGRAWDLAPTLLAGGAVIFPHAGIDVCGHQVAAAVHACLDSGAGHVLALGVLHALTEELENARVRVAAGGDVMRERVWGIQGPGVDARSEWRDEFSLSSFLFLWEEERARRGVAGPELLMRYPYLAGGRPEILPGIEELKHIVRQVVVVATGDLFHHGVGYGDPREESLAPHKGGLPLARERIEEGLALLRDGDYWAYNQHCVDSKSDARDVGQVLRYLLGPVKGHVLDLVADDTAPAYGAPSPTWVAGALVELVPWGSPASGTRA